MTSPLPEEFGGMLAGMAKFQQELEAAQASAQSVEVTGSAGGGAVKVRASGDFSFDAVTIDPKLVEDGDISVLEDLVLAAIRNAVTQLFETRKNAMGGLMSGAIGSFFVAEPDPESGKD